MKIKDIKECYKNIHDIMREHISYRITYAECLEIIDHSIINDIEDFDEDILINYGTYHDSKESVLNTVWEQLDDCTIHDLIDDHLKTTAEYNKTIGDIIIDNYKYIVKLSTGNYFYYYG